MKYTMLDLFSGAGGLHMGFEETGLYETVAFSEINTMASATLKRAWPTIPNLGDITKIHDFPSVEVITGGFPCQDISSAGSSQLGLAGSRSGLWFHMLRAINQIKPKGVFIENVALMRKRGLNVVLHGLANAGYDAEWYTIAASHVGAPHKRSRLFIIAYRVCSGGEGLGEPFKPRTSRQWLWAGSEDLREIYNSPFEPGARWPQPLLRRMDDGLANKTHRLGQIGNGVVVPLITQFAHHMSRRIKGGNL